MSAEKKVRVRFAPSPTGPLHIGGVRTALYNYLFAKKHGGDFVLRIEDTDQTRFVEGAEEYIIESLKWCGISPNEGAGFGEGPYAPYKQSERRESYRQYAEQLINSGHAYYAFDTTEELDDMRKKIEASGGTSSYNAITRQSMRNSLTLSEDDVNKLLEEDTPYVVRIKIPRNEEIKVQDIIRGWVVVNSSQLDDKVLFKSDGMPTYHLANIVDDHAMEITHVIRGEEWLPSAPLHVLLYHYLGWEESMPQFAHLPLLLKPDGNGKLSKRDGDRLGFPVFPLEWQDPSSKEVSSGYREKGYLPEGFINMLALLGWHSSGNQELFTLDELVKEFSLERVSKSGAKFDPEKAKWFNQQYLRQTDDAVLAKGWMASLEERGIATSLEHVTKVVSLIKEKAFFANEFWDLGHYFFTDPISYDEKVIKKRWKENSPEFFHALIENYQQLSDFTSETLESTFKKTAEDMGINPGHVMQLFRVCVSGFGGGPVLFDMVELLGKEVTIERLKLAIEKFSNQPA